MYWNPTGRSEPLLESLKSCHREVAGQIYPWNVVRPHRQDGYFVCFVFFRYLYLPLLISLYLPLFISPAVKTFEASLFSSVKETSWSLSDFSTCRNRMLWYVFFPSDALAEQKKRMCSNLSRIEITLFRCLNGDCKVLKNINWKILFLEA